MKNQKKIKIPDHSQVIIEGNEQQANISTRKWIEISYNGKKGWVDTDYIAQYIPNPDFTPKKFRSIISPAYLYYIPSFTKSRYMTLDYSSDEIYTQIDDFQLNSEFENLEGKWLHVKTKSGSKGFLFTEFFREFQMNNKSNFPQNPKLIYQIDQGDYRYEYYSKKTELTSTKLTSLKFLNPHEFDFCLNLIFERGNCRNTRFKSLYNSCPNKFNKDSYLENYKINSIASIEFITKYKKNEFPKNLNDMANFCNDYSEFIQFITENEFNFLTTLKTKYLKNKTDKYDPNFLISNLDKRIEKYQNFEDLVYYLPYIWWNPLNHVYQSNDSQNKANGLWDYFLKKNNIYVETIYKYDAD
ncbi:hypothetical protein ND856_19365 [Leptospira bandrabouensis]|uniref:hypothetical protein n=1 Tax=Leptospira bandrabouensis TaxID=2484903 RepID=UPI00223CF75E|nr:hypothetical protein [Leptospira bandrabouensis]MCW7479468.1 hypothetical protein [Leptospira bandrabouensis]MCW7487151.1 hypothetical protein [Leptospira bandrabouensis]